MKLPGVGYIKLHARNAHGGGLFRGTGYTDALSVALYGSSTQGDFYLDALAGYANANNRLQRLSLVSLQS